MYRNPQTRSQYAARRNRGSARAACAARGGLTLLELLISTVLVSTVIAMTVPTLKLIHSQDRAADQHQEAGAAVQNIMADLMAQNWDELNPSAAAAIELPEALQRQLRDPVLSVAIDDLQGTPAAKRIRVELTWQDLAGQRLPPVRLVAWRYRQGADS